MWGDLAPGQRRVGFRTIFGFDLARPWKKTRDYTGRFSPDPAGRPVQINVWYPATKDGPCDLMTFQKYVVVETPKEMAALGDLMYRRNQSNAKGSVEAAQLASLMAVPMSACANATPATKRAPLVLYAGGMNAEINSNVVLAEYLASHGYIVASIPATRIHRVATISIEDAIGS